VWALRSNAHTVSPVFANEFWVRNPAPPSAVRTVFSPRSRFEPKISLAQTFLAKRSVSRAIQIQYLLWTEKEFLPFF